MKLENLKAEKFGKVELSKEMLNMVYGGGTQPTAWGDGQSQGTDTVTYSCSGANGNLYESMTRYSDGQSTYLESDRMFANTVASDYE